MKIFLCIAPEEILNETLDKVFDNFNLGDELKISLKDFIKSKFTIRIILGKSYCSYEIHDYFPDIENRPDDINELISNILLSEKENIDIDSIINDVHQSLLLELKLMDRSDIFIAEGDDDENSTVIGQ